MKSPVSSRLAKIDIKKRLLAIRRPGDIILNELVTAAELNPAHLAIGFAGLTDKEKIYPRGTGAAAAVGDAGTESNINGRYRARHKGCHRTGDFAATRS